MTVSKIRVRLPTKFPSSVTATSPIVLDRTGGAYTFSFDASVLETTLGGVYQGLDPTLTALAALDSTAGLLTQTDADIFVRRTLTGTANEITVTNGAGTAGNPTLSIPAALTFTGKTITGGTFTGGLWNKVTITAPATAATLTLIDNTTVTGPAASDTLVGKATTDIFTNKTFDSAGTGNVMKVSGVTVSRGQFPGESTTGSATAGNVGEYIESVVAVGSATALTTATGKTVASISLTAGDWDVSGNIGYNTAASTSVTFLHSTLSLATNVVDQTVGRENMLSMAATVPGALSPAFQFPIGPVRISVSGATSVFLVAQASFTVSTLNAFGIIRARRVR